VTTYAESIQRAGARIFQGTCLLPLDRCIAYIEDRIEANDYRTHEVYDARGESTVNTKSRDSKAITPKHDEELAFYIYEAVQRYFQENFAAEPADSLVLSQHEFFAYPPGVGLKMHSDDHALGPDGSMIARDDHRGITAILYLNSGFTGGEINFPKQEVSIAPTAGKLVIFPSNKNFRHEVKPILSGWRYSYQRVYGILRAGSRSFEVGMVHDAAKLKERA
jgi:hypothetical protein